MGRLIFYDECRNNNHMEHGVPLPGGKLEYAILAALWELETASVREIHDRVGKAGNLAYTTTAKVLDRLRAKGLVSREKKGKAFVYRARFARSAVEQARARATLGGLLGPAPHAAVATLVEAVEALDPGLLDKLAEAVAARRRSHDAS